MKITGFEFNSEPYIGQISGDSITPIARLQDFWSDPYTPIQNNNAKAISLDTAKLKPSVPLTGKVICIGLNYKAHAAEVGMAIPEKPVVFSRFPETLISDGDSAPMMDTAYDWEAELGVIIGQKTLSATEDNALDAVFGYCTFNDLSCRRLQIETDQWTLGKNADRSGPMGYVVTKDEAGNPAEGWAVTTHVNGERVQNGITSDFIFSVPKIIAFVSRSLTLNPGDLIITGTPSGIGAKLSPPRFLKPGDTVRVEVEGLGAVTTPIVDRD